MLCLLFTDVDSQGILHIDRGTDFNMTSVFLHDPRVVSHVPGPCCLFARTDGSMLTVINVKRFISFWTAHYV